jgi:hypothetical protein
VIAGKGISFGAQNTFRLSPPGEHQPSLEYRHVWYIDCKPPSTAGRFIHLQVHDTQTPSTPYSLYLLQASPELAAAALSGLKYRAYRPGRDAVGDTYLKYSRYVRPLKRTVGSDRRQTGAAGSEQRTPFCRKLAAFQNGISSSDIARVS